VRTLFFILGIWVLMNFLFVVVMATKLQQRSLRMPRSYGTSKDAYPFDGEETAPLRFIIISIAMVALFALSPPMADAAAAISRTFGMGPRID
jgi:hypothetical protein